MADTGAGRLAAMFAAGRAEGRAGLLPFMTAGIPDAESSPEQAAEALRQAVGALAAALRSRTANG